MLKKMFPKLCRSQLLINIGCGLVSGLLMAVLFAPWHCLKVQNITASPEPLTPATEIKAEQLTLAPEPPKLEPPKLEPPKLEPPKSEPPKSEPPKETVAPPTVASPPVPVAVSSNPAQLVCDQIGQAIDQHLGQVPLQEPQPTTRPRLFFRLEYFPYDFEFAQARGWIPVVYKLVGDAQVTYAGQIEQRQGTYLLTKLGDIAGRYLRNPKICSTNYSKVLRQLNYPSDQGYRLGFLVSDEADDILFQALVREKLVSPDPKKLRSIYLTIETNARYKVDIAE